MKIAIPVWHGRVSPLLDTAHSLLLVEKEGGREVVRSEVPLAEGHAPRRAQAIAESGIDLLICGAVSRPLAELLAARGVRLIPWISGEVEEILEAQREGRLSGQEYLMPGCRRRCRRGGKGTRSSEQGSSRGRRGPGPGRRRIKGRENETGDYGSGWDL